MKAFDLADRSPLPPSPLLLRPSHHYLLPPYPPTYRLIPESPFSRSIVHRNLTTVSRVECQATSHKRIESKIGCSVEPRVSSIPAPTAFLEFCFKSGLDDILHRHALVDCGLAQPFPVGLVEADGYSWSFSLAGSELPAFALRGRFACRLCVIREALFLHA